MVEDKSKPEQELEEDSELEAVIPYGAGRIKQLYVDKGGCYVMLAHPYQNSTGRPKDDRFRLPITNPNYNAMYALALACSVHGYNLKIRTIGPIVSTEVAVVNYFMLDL